MCSIFSVCSKRFSVITMSMVGVIWCFGSTVRFHPLGVLSNGTTQQTCQPSSTVLRLPRPNGICTLALQDALPAPSCTLPRGFQT